MKIPDAQRAIRAAMSITSGLGLATDDVVVLRDSDKLIVRVLPCDVVARIAHVGRELAAFEVELAQRLAETRSPVAALDPRVEPGVHVHDGFALTLWTYYDAIAPQEIAPDGYADALHRLHAGMRRIDMTTPHFTDRVAQARSLLADRDISPDVSDADRALLRDILQTASDAIEAYRAPEQMLHGEPHPGNVMKSRDGLVFIDLETCCRGPAEYDIAHVADLDGSRPDAELSAVTERYPGADPELVALCHVLMLAMITSWRWHRDDQLPDGRRLAVRWITRMRETLADGAR